MGSAEGKRNAPERVGEEPVHSARKYIAGDNTQRDKVSCDAVHVFRSERSQKKLINDYQQHQEHYESHLNTTRTHLKRPTVPSRPLPKHTPPASEGAAH